MFSKEKKYKPLTSKIIKFTTIVFFMLIVVSLIVLYPHLNDFKKSQIENFSVNSFFSFCYQLDELFLSVEKLGEEYVNELHLIAYSKDFEVQTEKLTTSLLNINPFISEVTVYFFSDPTISAFSFSCYNFNRIIKYEKGVDSAEFYNLVDKELTTGEKEKYWSVPHRYSFDNQEDNKSSAITGVYGVPIISNNKVIGVALLHCRISIIESLMDKLNIGGHSYNVLIGSDGNIAVHLLEKYVMHSANTDEILSKINNLNINTFKIDSLGDFECPNSLAMGYKLRNDWIFMTIFPENFLFDDYENLRKTILIILIFGIVFFGIITVGTNALLYNFKFVIRKITDFSEYDILDWKLSVIKSKDDIEVFTTTFNRLLKAYINVQNKYTDLLTENEKAILDKKHLNLKIESIIKEETESITAENKNLNTSLNNMAEFNKIGKSICSSLDMKEVSKLVYKHLEQIIPITFFGIFLHNKEKNILECECGIKNGELVSDFSLSVIEKNTISAICFERNQTISINNFDIEANLYLIINPFDPLDTKCNSQYFTTIISNNNEVLGVFTIQCKPKGVFKDFDAEYLDNMKNYINMAINNIISYRTLKNYLTDMELTQDRLIQNERMASVGQLSAGIAHEIKNPLNFVINFSEISASLIKELDERIQDYKNYTTTNSNANNAEPSDDATPSLSEIEEDIEDMIDNMVLNLNKIVEHSKRVDQIIKNMMLHSNSRADQFVKTDINNMVKEYSKLTYKGFRSNNPTLNIDVQYDLDATIMPISIVPNNFSRVIINIVSNSCFALTEKSKKYDNTSDYTPEIKITTINLDNDYIQIRIRDNGDGIPNEIKNKIFTPFFTTKSVGDGTGLGLSICYDIINIEHHGEITFETEPEKFAEFVIKIPKNK